VQEHIRSIGELEVLLLLHRTSERWWTADEVNSELRTSLQSAIQYLERLLGSGLLEEGARAGRRAFRFIAADTATSRTVMDLAESFRYAMAAIVDLVYARRSSSIHEFAEAFRLTPKKRKPDDG
jgi:hypothetical protein